MPDKSGVDFGSDAMSKFNDMIDYIMKQNGIIQPNLPAPAAAQAPGQSQATGADAKPPTPQMPQGDAVQPQQQAPAKPATAGGGGFVDKAISKGLGFSLDSGGDPNNMPKMGSELKGLEAQIQNLTKTTGAAASSAASSAAKSGGSGGGMGSIISGIATVASLVGWIICTELMVQKRMPYRWWVYGATVFAEYDEIGKNGYYLWAIPSVLHLRKHPNSLYSRFLCTIFNWRAENIAAHAGVKGARKLRRGAAVTAILYPICWILGRVVYYTRGHLDWQKVYKVNNG